MKPKKKNPLTVHRRWRKQLAFWEYLAVTSSVFERLSNSLWVWQVDAVLANASASDAEAQRRVKLCQRFVTRLRRRVWKGCSKLANVWKKSKKRRLNQMGKRFLISNFGILKLLYTLLKPLTLNIFICFILLWMIDPFTGVNTFKIRVIRVWGIYKFHQTPLCQISFASRMRVDDA